MQHPSEISVYWSVSVHPPVWLGGCAPLRNPTPDVCVSFKRVVERWGQVGGVARVLSEGGAELPAVKVLGALSRRSGALTLVRVVGDMFGQVRGALVGDGAESRALGAGAVGGVGGVRRVRVHGGHGGGECAGVGPGRTVEFI